MLNMGDMNMKSKPNILLLFSDQHNARVLGSYGDNEVHTPHLDQLAADGVRFENAYAQNPICTPSRMCFMSGQYTHNFGYYGLMGPKPEHLPNMFQHLKKQGYTTGMAGKTHTPTGWLAPHCDYVADGYGYESPTQDWSAHLEEGWQGSKLNEYSLYLQNKGIAHLRDDKYIPEWYEKHGYEKGQGVDAKWSQLSEDDTIEAWAADRTNQFIEQSVKNEKPFCFWMTVPRPHQTYLPAKKFWDLYEDQSLTFPPNADNRMTGRHESAKETQDKFQNQTDWRIFDPKDWNSTKERVLRGYYACVSQVDDAVGRVMQKLEELGIRENTIVVYASDHGEFAGEHGMIEKAPGINFRCVTRIPFIWSWPGHIPKNEVRHSLAESIDFLPTICSLAGLDMPNWVDGLDLTAALMNDKQVKSCAFTENPYTKTIHTSHYKFTDYLPEMCNGNDFGELYDLQADPWEMNNLYFNAEYANVVHDLRRQLFQWLVRTTRHVTMNPWIPEMDGLPMRTWEFAESFQLPNQDAKVGFDLARKMIAERQLNYL
jgi:choline-sulfatase/uncharacterized sulfatase